MRNLTKIILNSILYLFYFYLFYWVQTKSIFLSGEYSLFLIVFFISLLLSTIATRKYEYDNSRTYNEIAKKHITSFVLLLLLLVISSSFVDYSRISRLVIVGSLIIPHIFELIFLRIYLTNARTDFLPSRLIIYPALFFRELAILIVVAAWLLYSRFNSLSLLTGEQLIVLTAVLIAWFLSHIFSSQFGSTHRTSIFWRDLWRYAKTNIVFIILVLFLTLLVRMGSDYTMMYIKIPIYYSLISSVGFLFVYVNKIPKSTDEVTPILRKATYYPDSLSLETEVESRKDKYKVVEHCGYDSSLRDNLKDVYLSKFPEIFNFIDNNVDFCSVNFVKAVVIRSADVYNVEVLPDKSLSFFMNLHEMNDIRRLNEYFIKVNNRLIDGGIFAFQFEPIRFRFARFLTRYPTYLAVIFYVFDFVWRRILPKLPFFKKFYFAVTKGKNRVFSLAEGLGRLYFCGFELIDMKEISHRVFVIAKKTKEPSSDPNPSYGPFFKMKRIGKDGKPFYVYKLRTMHPYAEYLQEFIYEKFSLKEGGKFNEDFRISSWGKVLRKLWLDEFPMFINFFKGEMKLVGIRPLSSHYLSLYDESVKVKRFKTKPGLVPPFYADMPKTLEEIMRSEENYLDNYFKNPIATDLQYFLKAFYNIVFKNARSA